MKLRTSNRSLNTTVSRVRIGRLVEFDPIQTWMRNISTIPIWVLSICDL
ncbi:hypothetical protein [Pacificibacter maritimus]|nr:hypothetical protein [Pacificibacter maritimus]